MLRYFFSIWFIKIYVKFIGFSLNNEFSFCLTFVLNNGSIFSAIYSLGWSFIIGFGNGINSEGFFAWELWAFSKPETFSIDTEFGSFLDYYFLLITKAAFVSVFCILDLFRCPFWVLEVLALEIIWSTLIYLSLVLKLSPNCSRWSDMRSSL